MEKLKVDDVVTVYNPLMKEGGEDYPVTKVVGNKAYTRFRNFNTKIHYRGEVYEYGKRLSRVYNNTYIVKRNLQEEDLQTKQGD